MVLSSIQWKHKDSTRPQNVKTVQNGKVMPLILFDKCGITNDHIALRGDTVTGKYYSNIQLWKNVVGQLLYKNILKVSHFYFQLVYFEDP